MDRKIELESGRFGAPVITASGIETVQKAEDRDKIGNIFTRAWDAVADWFCDTDRAEAKKCLFDLYNDSATAEQKISSFYRLNDLVGMEYKDRFSVVDDQDGRLTFKLALGIDGIEDFSLTPGIGDADDFLPVSQNGDGSVIHTVCGFRNLGNTCYANSALKFLIHAMGEGGLMNHLADFARTTQDPAKREAAEKLMDVVDSSLGRAEPLEDELKAFFSSLQGLDVFNEQDGSGEYLFKIVGVQNDAQEFLLKLAEAFDLSGVDGYSCVLEERIVKDDEQREPHRISAFSHDISVQDPHATLQDIVNATSVSEELKVRWRDEDQENSLAVKVKQWAVPDMSSFQRFNLHINALNYDVEAGEPRRTVLENANFTDDVVLTVLDEKTNTFWRVTLEPRDIVVQSGNASGGHYYMYTKQDENDWLKHDDSTVAPCKGLAIGEQAKLISFAVKHQVPLADGVVKS